MVGAVEVVGAAEVVGTVFVGERGGTAAGRTRPGTVGHPYAVHQPRDAEQRHQQDQDARLLRPLAPHHHPERKRRGEADNGNDEDITATSATPISTTLPATAHRVVPAETGVTSSP